MSNKTRIVKNAVSNLTRGGATALVALLMPPFLTRFLSPEQFNSWALALQFTTYVNYLDLGLQMSVARFVAQATEKSNIDRRNHVISASTLLLSGASAFALVVAVAFCVLLPTFYPHIQHGTLLELRTCFLILAFGMALCLPATVLSGTLIGIQRNEIPSVAIGLSRLASSALCIVLARIDHSIVGLAIATAAFTLASYVPQYFACKKLIPTFEISLRHLRRDVVVELARYTGSLSTWSLGMLLVSGLDLAIVAAVDFRNIGPYSIANSVVLLMSGLTGAVFSSFLAPASAMHARQEYGKLGAFVLRSTRIGTTINLLLGLCVVFLAPRILSHWVPVSYAIHATPIARALVIANLLRLVFTPYSVAVQAAGQQNRLVAAPLMEGFSNFIASVILGHYFGAIGVALGTLLGAIVACIWLVWHHIPRTTDVQMARRAFVSQGLILPSLCALPLVAPFIVASTWPFGSALALLILCLSAAAAISFVRIRRPELSILSARESTP